LIIAIPPQLNILEIAGGKQALYRIHNLVAVHGIPRLNGQFRIDPFYRQTLQPFHAHIVHLERQQGFRVRPGNQTQAGYRQKAFQQAV